MHFFQHKNIAKTIVFTFVSIILANSLLISFFYINNKYEDYDKHIIKIQKEQILLQQKEIKKQIDSIVNTIEFQYRTNQDKAHLVQNLINWINSISYDMQKSDYIFVYKVRDINGGNKFAELLINPNRPDLLGKYLSDDYTDAKGKQFRKEFLKDIRAKGESFVTYAYKKPSTQEVIEKISYFKYFKELNWIVAKGVYADDIDLKVEELRHEYDISVKKQILENVYSFLIIFMIAVVVAYLMGRRIEMVLAEKEKEVEHKRAQLENLNRNLQSQVKVEVEKASEQEKILMQKSKFIAMGEMISNIAHQWRQPISELSTIFMNIKMRYDLEKLDSDFMQKKAKETEHLLEYMSTTIDDFRSFFKPNKQKETFKIEQVIEAVLHIVGLSIESNNIKIHYDGQKDLVYKGYPNELEQAILNIIGNAKDALSEQKIQNAFIKIDTFEDKGTIYISIRDNAKGIQSKPIEAIFEPYFTTKEDHHGTGIGLYMTKMIVEKNMQGKLSVENISGGAKFMITLPIIASKI
ncbi:MAG: cache domain-containing protein [Campylobacterota bacterium]|nr:cache domain-containing protein [Campylobacterota bacterium]